MITQPMPFEDAIRHLLDKEQLPAEWDAATWWEQEADFRTQAFFVSRVENARFLDRAQTLLFDYLTKVRETVVGPDGVERTALSVSDRSHFVERMRRFMIEEGMAKPEDFKDVDQKDITDIRSLARLNLIFDTNVRQSYGFGQWKQGMEPAVLRAFPAARLIRERGVMEPRPRHQANLGEVLLKTDPRWAEFHNARSIGGFGVPWGPYGFNSGVTQEDVSRKEARALGLRFDTARQGMSYDPKLTDGAQASTKRMNPDLKRKLIEELRNGPKPRSPEEAARQAASQVRREMLNRGLTEAVTRGDTVRADKYRKALAELPPLRGLKVQEKDGQIVLEPGPRAGILPPLPDESERNQPSENAGLPRPGGDRSLVDAFNDFRRVLFPNGEVDGQEDYFDRSEQFRIIESEAIRLGVLYDGLVPFAEGGKEHDLIFDEATGTVLKFTKPTQAAFMVDFHNGKPILSRGDPLEYLDRLMIHDEVFGELTRFVGIGGEPNNRRIITRQPRVVGREAGWEEIVQLMVNDLGFIKLRHNYGIGYEDSYGFIRDDVAVFDMRPANLFMTDAGILIAVDSIPVRLNAATRAMFAP